MQSTAYHQNQHHGIVNTGEAQLSGLFSDNQGAGGAYADMNGGQMMANGRFMITKSIGKGSFGEIFQGLDTQSNKDVAIKMEHKHCKVKVLVGEAKILKQLQGIEGVPKFIWFGQEHNQNILVMELLGPSLSTLFKQMGSKFSLPTVLKLTDQILQRIESMHNAGYIHRDIKPNNFVMGFPGSANQNMVYLLDFGLSKPYKDIKRGVHFPQLPPGRALTGTARYASINSHQGFTLSRRDDLESIGYMIIQLLRGNLPWQGIGGANKLEKYSNILELKMQTVEEMLCKDMPEQFCKFLKYAKELEYDQKPDYRRMRHEFKVLFMEQCTAELNESNFRFDWHTFLPERNNGKKKGDKKKGLNILVSPLSPSKDPAGDQPVTDVQKSMDVVQSQIPQNQTVIASADQVAATYGKSQDPCGSGSQEVNMPNNHNTIEVMRQHPSEQNPLQGYSMVTPVQGQEVRQSQSIVNHGTNQTQQQITGQVSATVGGQSGIDNQNARNCEVVNHQKSIKERTTTEAAINKDQQNIIPHGQEGTLGAHQYRPQNHQDDVAHNQQVMTPSGMNTSNPNHPFNGKNHQASSSNTQPPTQSTPINKTTIPAQNPPKEEQSEEEEEVKIPILFNNFEGFNDKDSAHQSSPDEPDNKQLGFAGNAAAAQQKVALPNANRPQQNNNAGQVGAKPAPNATQQSNIAAKGHNNLQSNNQRSDQTAPQSIIQKDQQPNPPPANNSQQQKTAAGAQQSKGNINGVSNIIQQQPGGAGVQSKAGLALAPTEQPKSLQQAPQQAAPLRKMATDEVEVENDPAYIQNQVGEDPCANKILSFDIHLSVFTFNPNKRVQGRKLHLTAKQEQARLTRLKQLYGNNWICPSFLFQRDEQNHNSDSLCSMEPLLIQINGEGQIKGVESIGANGPSGRAAPTKNNP